jgi:hypothetical protein
MADIGLQIDAVLGDGHSHRRSLDRKVRNKVRNRYFEVEMHSFGRGRSRTELRAAVRA